MVRKITKEEFGQMSLARNGKRHPIAMLIEQLESGELLHIPRTDWHDKSRTPGYLAARVGKALGRKFQFYKEVNMMGWVVERTA